MATSYTPALSFERLVTAIGQVHAEISAQASRAVNTIQLAHCYANHRVRIAGGRSRSIWR